MNAVLTEFKTPSVSIIKRLRKASRAKLQNEYLRSSDDNGLRFVQYCLSLIGKGFDLSGYFDGAESAYGPVVEEGITAMRKCHKGFIYLAADPTMPAGVHKVGLTRKTPEDRMRSLETSGSLGHFILVKSWVSMNVAVTEAQCLSALADVQVKGELFLGHYTTLTEKIDRVLQSESDAIHALVECTRERL